MCLFCLFQVNTCSLYITRAFKTPGVMCKFIFWFMGGNSQFVPNPVNFPNFNGPWTKFEIGWKIPGTVKLLKQELLVIVCVAYVKILKFKRS